MTPEERHAEIASYIDALEKGGCYCDMIHGLSCPLHGFALKLKLSVSLALVEAEQRGVEKQRRLEDEHKQKG